jgi:hypothetical protein
VRRRNHRLDCEPLESRQLLAGFYIVNAYSGKVLDDPGASPNNFAVIDQWQLNGAGNHRWDLISVGSGYYEIRNEASGLVLDNSVSFTEGTPIDQFQGDDEALAPGKSVTVTLDFSMSGRRSRSLGKLDEDLEALLGI